MIVHALFVDPDGPYPRLGVDCWTVQRNGLTFDGIGPVVTHPPCGRWCALAKMNERRWGTKVGDDGGLFNFALQIVRQNGGVLEHPARSLAWAKYALPVPTHVGWNTASGLWSCEVWQSAYGHACHKRTWLLYSGNRPPFELDWRRDRSLATHQIGGGIHTGHRTKPRFPQRHSHLSPFAFAATLVRLAQWSRGEPGGYE